MISSLLYYTYFIISVLICVFFHELAHMIAAICCGVKVKEFALGFGPPLIKIKIKSIIYKLNLIPLGGYCRLQGEKSKVKEGWLTTTYSKKLIISLAGVFVNLVIAFICYIINYNSILLGLYIDLNLLKSIFLKQYDFIYLIYYSCNNIFLLQLGLLNLIAFITNILPLPTLDGGYVFLFPLEKIYKEKFPIFLEKITKIGFIVLLILQLLILYWVWIVK